MPVTFTNPEHAQLYPEALVAFAGYPPEYDNEIRPFTPGWEKYGMKPEKSKLKNCPIYIHFGEYNMHWDIVKKAWVDWQGLTGQEKKDLAKRKREEAKARKAAKVAQGT